jgi:sigma-B regulation protein RsbU (phosphoserine phosphatase)
MQDFPREPAPLTPVRRHPFAATAVLYLGANIGLAVGLGPRYRAVALLVAVPLVVAFEQNWRWTGAVTLLCAALVATIPLTYNRPYVETAVPLAGIAITGALGVAGSVKLQRRRTSLTHTRAAAEAAQRAILPDVPDRLGPLQLSCLYRSSAEEALVGGDFYKVIRSPWGTRMIVGDVEGKGLAAVSMSSLVLGCFREWAPRTERLEDLVAILDQRVRDYEERSAFVTAIVGTLGDDLDVELANCGHHFPVLARAGELITLAPPTITTPLGLNPSPGLLRRSLVPGDRLLFFTDGLIEARADGGGWVQLDDLLRGFADEPFDEALEGITARLNALGTLSDDLAMLLVEVPTDSPATEPAIGVAAHESG